MASTISAGTTTGTALNFTGDTSGNLAFQTQAGANTITVPNETGTIITTKTAGTVLQVQSTTLTSTFTSATGNSWVDITGLSVSITPKFSTSKILVSFSVSGTIFRPAVNAVTLKCLRGSTAIGIGDASGSVLQISASSGVASNDSMQTCAWQYLDSPATTSSTTYKLQIYQDTPANPFYINRTTADSNNAGRSVSTITVMEIAA